MKARRIEAARGDNAEKPKAFIGISLSNDVSAILRRLPAISGWADSNTQSFSFLIGDSLHKHNELAIEKQTQSSAQLRVSAKTRQICDAIDRLTTDRLDSRALDVILASQLAQEPTFNAKVRNFGDLYEGRKIFRANIDEATLAYLKRRGVSARPNDSAWTHSVRYQIEELAMFELLVERGFQSLVYPGPQLPIMKAIVSGALPNVSEQLEKLSLTELRIFEE